MLLSLGSGFPLEPSGWGPWSSHSSHLLMEKRPRGRDLRVARSQLQRHPGRDTCGVSQRWRQPRVEVHLRPPRPGTLLAGDVPASWPDLRDALAGCLREVGDKRDHGSDCALSNLTSSLGPWLPASTVCSQSSARESANQCPQPSGLPRLHSSLPILKGQKSLQESERQDGSDPTVARPSSVDDACSAVLARPSSAPYLRPALQDRGARRPLPAPRWLALQAVSAARSPADCTVAATAPSSCPTSSLHPCLRREAGPTLLLHRPQGPVNH